jgi:Holliday junction resolvase RusA-like endonuclease
MIKFSVPGPQISTNAAYRKRGHGYGMFLTPEAKAWKELVSFFAKKAMKGQPLFTRPVFVIATYYKKTRAGDVDASGKLLLDSLQGVCFENDSLVRVFTQVKDHDPKRPRVEVTVGEV